MKKLWQKIASGIALLVAGVGAVFAVLWYRDKTKGVSDRLKEQAEEQLRQTKENGKQAVRAAEKEAADGWAADQEEFMQKAKDEARTITPDELWDRLRGK